MDAILDTCKGVLRHAVSRPAGLEQLALAPGWSVETYMFLREATAPIRCQNIGTGEWLALWAVKKKLNNSTSF
jgi:hypothetical protein